jgi:hypothetical protein
MIRRYWEVLRDSSLLLLLAIESIIPVSAQSIPNPIGGTGCTGGSTALGVIWSVEQWMTAFQCKADATNGILNTPTITGPEVTAGSFSSPSITGGTFSSPTITSPTVTGGSFSNPSITGSPTTSGNWTFSPSSGAAITVNAPNPTTLGMNINGGVQVSAPSSTQAFNVDGSVGFTAPASGLAFQIDNAALTEQLLTVGSAGGASVLGGSTGNALSVTSNNPNGSAFGATLTGSGTGLGLLTPAATSANVFALIQNGQRTWTLGNSATSNILTLSSTAGGGTTWTPGGNVTIAEPSSGIALTVTGNSNNDTINAINNGGGASYVATLSVPGSGLEVATPAGTSANVFSLNQSGQTNWVLNNTPTTNLLVLESAAGGTSWSPAGNVTINTPSSGDTLTLNGIAGADAVLANLAGAGSAFVATAPAGAQINGLTLQQTGQSQIFLFNPGSTSNLDLNIGSTNIASFQPNEVQIDKTLAAPVIVGIGSGALQLGAPTAFTFDASAFNPLPSSTGISQGSLIAWNLSNGTGEADFINSFVGSSAQGGFEWLQSEASSLTSLMTLSPAGALSVNALTVAGANVFNEQSETWTMGTGCTVATSVNILFQQSGHTVTMFISSGTCTASSSGISISLTGAFPAGMAPSRAQMMAMPLVNNGLLAPGVLTIESGTAMEIQATPGVTLTGSAGFPGPGTTLTYTLD